MELGEIQDVIRTGLLRKHFISRKTTLIRQAARKVGQGVIYVDSI